MFRKCVNKDIGGKKALCWCKIKPAVSYQRFDKLLTLNVANVQKLEPADANLNIGGLN